MNIFKTISFTDDKSTISNGWNDLSIRYHYNFIENGIISNINECKTVFDVGPGYGHWIRFFQEVYGSPVDFIDLSKNVQRDLQKRFEITGHLGSIHKFRTKAKYDVVNAIGVLHHIMKDKDLLKAIEIIKSIATEYIVIGTAFNPARNDKYRKFRSLEWWKEQFDNSIVVSPNPPGYCRRHLDLIIVKQNNR